MAQEKGVARFLYLSPLSTLDPSSSPGEIKTLLKEFNKEKSPYIFGKIEAEKVVWRSIMEGMPGIIINSAPVLSPYLDLNPHLNHLYTEGSAYFSHAVFNFIGIQDWVQAMIQIMESGQIGNQYILKGGSTDFLELINRINQRLGKKSPQKEVKNFGWNPFFSWTSAHLSLEQKGFQELYYLSEGQNSIFPDFHPGLFPWKFQSLEDLF